MTVKNKRQAQLATALGLAAAFGAPSRQPLSRATPRNEPAISKYRRGHFIEQLSFNDAKKVLKQQHIPHGSDATIVSAMKDRQGLSLRNNEVLRLHSTTVFEDE